jgi:hypothetical protein
VEDGALPCPAGSDEGDALAGGDGEVEVFEDGDGSGWGPVGHGEVLGLDGGLSGSHESASGRNLMNALPCWFSMNFMARVPAKL